MKLQNGHRSDDCVSGIQKPKGQLLGISCVLIAIVILAGGCVSQPAMKVPMTVGEGVEAAQNQMEAAIEQEREALRADFDRIYGDELLGLDLSATEKRLHEEYERKFEEKITAEYGVPVLVKCRIQFYRDSLKAAQENGWSIDEFLKAPQRHLRRVRTEAYAFVDPDSPDKSWGPIGYSMLEDPVFNRCAERIRPIELKHRIIPSDKGIFFIYPKRVLEQVPKEALREAEHPYVVLNGLAEYIKSTGLNFNVKNPKSAEIGLEMIAETKPFLKKKYGETFECINEYPNIYSSLKTPEIVFETGSVSEYKGEKTLTDTYLPVLAQRYLGRMLDEIIAGENLQDRLLYYVRIDNQISNLEVLQPGWNTADLSSSESVTALLLDGYRGNYEIGLYYLVEEPAEPVDQEGIARVREKLDALIPSERTYIETYVFDVRPKDRTILGELFRTSGNYDYLMDADGSLSSIYSDMAQIRGETEGFEYLDAYGVKVRKLQ